MKTCRKEWSTDRAIGCDCLFCGIIQDTTHPKFSLCTDMDPKDRPFSIMQDYILNVTATKNGVISNANMVVTADQTIRKFIIILGI